jgi:LmbE family N-acetylglucosaminyl deacetylase
MNSLFKEKTLLVIAAHPDDEILGCGGLISKVKYEGGKVFVLIMTVGDEPQYGKQSIAASRTKEAEEVMKFMRVDGYEFCLPGNKFHLRLDAVDKKTLVDIIEKTSRFSLQYVKPDIVAIPHPHYNQDERAVFEAAFTALRSRPAHLKPPQTLVISYEDLSHNWATTPFNPTMYVDIKDFINLKCKAISLYSSQVGGPTHYISEDSVRLLAKFRGRQVGLEAAEAFMIHRLLL